MAQLRRRLAAAALIFAAASAAPAQTPPAEPASKLDPALAKLLHWSGVGPERGGRSAAVAGHAAQPLTFYFGACGGGVWKSDDGGAHWRNVSDGFFGGSIGAIAVAPSDPNVVYVGGGEVTVRGNWSAGDGMWRSDDAGKSWRRIGLADSQCIPRVRVHPKDENLVYAAVLGHLCGPNETRGVYRSQDGGVTWRRVLQVDENVGACDLLIDPGNPRVIWATTWRVRRTPYSLESGGPGSGLWRSGDGGDTWSEFTRSPGLPGGAVGIIGIAISPADPRRMWAQVEAQDGGLFRSDDGGSHWSRINDDHELTQRAWYFSRVYADPKDRDRVWLLNVGLFRSDDGGKTLVAVPIPHGDNHDLWIDPNDPRRMVEANDGGACVTFDGGANWSTLANQPTAQLYRVAADTHFPWRIYGAQQDNSTLRLDPLGGSYRRGRNWESTAGGESGWLAPDPKNPEIVYGGSYGGTLERLDHANEESRGVMVWPDNPMGWGAGDLKYRFQWNYPLLFSRHDPTALYAGANVLFVTRDEGQSWSALSTDLTRNDKSKMGPSGGPITKDNTSVEYYGTIFSVCESALEPGVIWCGSDDGLVHLTRDGGRSWSNVTPKFMPEWIQVNSLEANPFVAGGVYVAATAYKSDDARPYLYKSDDYGATWTLIVHGIADNHFTRVVRADPVRRGLLYAGTEAGACVSFDDGGHWRSLQLDLPVVPITDLLVKDGTLVAATQGRSFWILDELDLLRATGDALPDEPVKLLPPRPVDALHRGALVDCWLKEKPADGVKLALEITDAQGQKAHGWSRPQAEGDEALNLEAGVNRLTWNCRWPDAKGFDGLILWGGTLSGPDALPGSYTVRLKMGEGGEPQFTTTLELRADPRASVPPADARERFDFLIGLRDLLTRTHVAIVKIRELKPQLETLARRIEKRKECEEVLKRANELKERLTAVEEALYQTKLKSGEDALNHPIRLNNKLADLYSNVLSNGRRPTEQSKQFRAELTPLLDAELAKYQALIDQEIPALNRLAMEKQVPAIFVQEP
jgi:photosystem II stability/assembly factor-like uncharacterized protein/DNA-binding FrmR family transcriptional regulator